MTKVSDIRRRIRIHAPPLEKLKSEHILSFPARGYQKRHVYD